MKPTIKNWSEVQNDTANDSFILREESNFVWYSPPSADSLRETVVLHNLWARLDPVETMNEVRGVLSNGIPKLSFERLREVTGLSLEDQCEAVRIPYRTLARRQVFKPEESDRVFRVAMVFQTILDVLGDLEVARKWFTRSKRALGGATPLECCATEVGAGEIFDLLGRIEHGVFS